MILTEQLDLRGGRHCWVDKSSEQNSDALPAESDVVVIGAGIVGAMVADRLSEAGFGVVVLDRRPPATGATAASTALVMWGADVPLSKLAEAVGMQSAAQRWRRVFESLVMLDQQVTTLGIECGWRARPELYLAGDVLDAGALKNEADARVGAGLPSEFVDGGDLRARFAIPPRDGLLSSGSYEVDPIALTRGLLDAARSRGAQVCFPFDVARLYPEDDGRVRVFCADGANVLAKQVVLASGYEAARLFLPKHFSLSSSYAIASKPDVAPAWGGDALIWEASDPYLYARATRDRRIIIGGEDEDFLDAQMRDALIPQKRAALEKKAAALLGRDDIEFECAWAATFGGSPDGLPAIGPASNMDNVILAYGYGGNGVTFASLGADIVAKRLRRVAEPGAEWFDPYRPAQEH